jgi:hypothetical protein
VTRFLIVSLPFVIAGAFLVGRATSPAGAVGASTTHVYTGRLNDVFRVPAAALRCEVNAEAGSVKVSCGHVPYARARHDVVFYRDNILVFRLGNPDTPVWSARGKP